MNKDNDLDFAEIDLEREKRTGFPEVIYGETKTPVQSAKIAKKIYDKSDIFLITRTNSKTYNQVKKLIPEANFDRSAKLIWATRKQKTKNAHNRRKPILKSHELPTYSITQFPHPFRRMRLEKLVWNRCVSRPDLF